MFAIALWDRTERVLYLVRDRLGEEPLYYNWNGQTVMFASELKALRAGLGLHRDINRQALALFLKFGYIPAPHSIYEGVFKLPPACMLVVRGTQAKPAEMFFARAGSACFSRPCEPGLVWSPIDAASSGLSAKRGKGYVGIG